jgi:hypothetical protein
MELNDYPHFFFTEYERLCSTSQNRSGFPRVLYNALLRPGYDGDTPIYQCQLSWSGFVIGSKPNTGVEVMAHIALTSLCEDRLAATAALHISLLSIQNQENPVWQQRLEAMSNLKGPHFHVGMTSLARYVQYLFNLQHNIAWTGMQQRMRLTAYKKSAIATSHELEKLRHENAILHSGARPPSK